MRCPCHMMTSGNGNIFHITGPFWRESTGDQWIPLYMWPVDFPLHVRGIHWSLVDSPNKGQWCRDFSMNAWTNCWTASGNAGELRCLGAHLVFYMNWIWDVHTLRTDYYPNILHSVTMKRVDCKSANETIITVHTLLSWASHGVSFVSILKKFDCNMHFSWSITMRQHYHL